MRQIQQELGAAVDELSQAAQKISASEEAQKLKTEAEKAAQSAQSAGQEAVEEIRPHLLTAFEKIRTEIDYIIKRIEQQTPDAETAPASTEETDQAE